MKCGSLANFRLCHLPTHTLVANGRIKTDRKFHFPIPRGLLEGPFSATFPASPTWPFARRGQRGTKPGQRAVTAWTLPPQVHALALSVSAEQTHQTADASRQLQCKDQAIMRTTDTREARTQMPKANAFRKYERTGGNGNSDGR